MFKGSHNLTQSYLVNFIHHSVLQISKVTKLPLMCIYTFGHLKFQRIPSFLFSVNLVLIYKAFQFPWCDTDLRKNVHFLNMSANLEKSAVATGLEKVRFYSNSKER